MSANRRLILKIGVVLKSMGILYRLLSVGWDLTFNIEVGDIATEYRVPLGCYPNLT